MNPVFLYYLTLSVQQDPVMYPTQSTKKVRLLFRSLYIFTFNGSFKGGGSLSILILSSGMKATTKFLALESKAIFGCFLPFSKICFSGLLWCSDRGGGLRNIICQNSWKTNKFFSSFLTLFSDFSWTWKSISQQKLLEKGLFRNTLVFFYVWFCVQGGGEGGTGGTLMKLSFDKAL